jgi:hypothetical protein
MRHDTGIAAASCFEGVGQFRQPLEGSLVIDSFRQLDDFRASPGRVNTWRRHEGVAHNIVEQIA